MDRLRQDLLVALRALLRQRTFAIVAIVTLALGVGATTAIFSVVYGILLKPLPYEQADRLVALGQTSKREPAEPVDGSASPVNFQDWTQQSKTIPAMALYARSRAVVNHQDQADVVAVGVVTPEFFAVFAAPPIVGRTFTADEDRPNGPRAVVIGYAYWQERFGGRSDVLSQSVEVSGVAWPIVGVAPRGFDFPSSARFWVPVRNNDEQCGRSCVFLNGIGRLADGVSVEAAKQEMATIAERLERQFPGDNTDVTVFVQTLQDRTVGSVRLALLVLLAAVAMVLLIACANVANLVLVRGASRQSEIAVRTALGAGRGGVVSFLLAENLVLAIAGGLAGVVLARWGVDALKAVAPATLPRLADVGFDLPTFAFAMAVVTATAVLFGLGPALQLSRAPLLSALGHRGSIGAGRSRWTRSSLLVAEVGLSLVLLLGAGLLLRSLSELQRTDLGFKARDLTMFTISLPPARYPAAQMIAAHDQLDEQVAAMPGISGVARISGLPLGPSENVLSFTRPDQPPPAPGQGPAALYRIVDADYFRMMEIPVLAGRGFEPTDRQGAQRVVIISRRLAEVYWPGEQPVGKPIQINDGDPAIVVGVVANVRSQVVARQADPEMYVPHAQTSQRSVTYVVKSALGTPQVLSAARDIVRRIDPRLPLISPGSMNDLVDQQLARPRFYLVLLSLFAVLAVVLAAVGIYGVVAYVVTQRTREIGLRMALGARQGDVVRLMLWQGLRPAAVGMALGLVAAIALGRLVQELLYQVQPYDPLTFAGVSTLLLAIVLIACAIPARRASAVPPSDALRAE